MTDHELDSLVASAASVTDAVIAQWTRTAPFEELCEEIMSTTPVDEHPLATEPTLIPLTGHRRGSTSSPRRWGRVAALATAAAASVAFGLVINLRGNDESANTAWAAQLVEFAQRSPLMLLNDPDWQVTRADESGDEGEMTFTNGDRSADLHWRQGPLAQWLDDRMNSGTDRGTHPVVNGTANIVQYDDNGEYTALWEGNGRVLEFRTSATSLVEFGSLLDTLHVVDVDTWLTAMPDSVIKQADVLAVITDMLTGIPLPEGFDTTSLADDDQINDRYQLGARVVSAVSCIWIEQWINAKATGDTVAAGAAADAMRTSSMWPIIQEMNQSGDYGKALQMHVDAMTDNPPPLGLGGPTLEESYRLALGCPE